MGLIRSNPQPSGYPCSNITSVLLDYESGSTVCIPVGFSGDDVHPCSGSEESS
jgi:hypothetical protein